MITIHHLAVSQSERIVWLMEELGLPYKLKWYERKPNRLAPDELLALHPTAMAPVIEDGGVVLTESAVIVEYICHRHAGGRLALRPEHPGWRPPDRRPAERDRVREAHRSPAGLPQGDGDRGTECRCAQVTHA